MTSNKEIYKITYPLVLTLVAQNIVNVTDTAFLGRVSEVALGGSAIAGVFFFAIYVIGYGFSQGVQILIGRRNGEKNYHQIGPIFNNGLIFIALLSLVFFVAAYFTDRHIMKWLVSSSAVYEASLQYLDIRIYAFFFAFINVHFRGFFVGITQTKVLTISAFITTIVNLIFNYLLIFGNFGFPKMGIGGSAMASVIAEAVTTIYLFIHTLHKEDFKIYGLYIIKRLDLDVIYQVLKLSVFMMFQFFISISTWFMFFIFIERMGERPLAATNIGRSLYILLMIPGSALATTVNTLISNMIGAGKMEEVLPFTWRMIKLVVIVVAPIMLITFFLPRQFAAIYTNESGLIEASVPVMQVVSVAMIFCAVGNIIFNAVAGTGNTKVSFIIEFVTLFFYLSFVYYTAIVHPYPVSVVWMSEFVYWTIIGTAGYIYLLKGKWRNKSI